ncbi:MAG: hypothetical protein AB7I13_16040, partial [Vicinamibacterales bacterium]
RNVTRVPLCGGVPDDSSTWATMVAEPLAAKVFVAVVKVIDDPVGASKGTFSQPTDVRPATRTAAPTN